MMKTKVFLGLSVVGTAMGTTTACSQAEQEQKPNVIYILVDDLGYGDLSCYGQTHFQTPNIDAMAVNGMKFTQNYAGSTVSAPSRCSLLTGKHTGNSYVRGNKGVKGTDGRTYDTPIPSEEFTLGELFQSAGYTTACIGKWGLGGIGTEGHPNDQGFDYFYGYLGQGYAHKYYPKFLHENKTEISLDGEYSHDLAEAKVTDFISENRDNPFFIYLTYTIPHAELLLPDEYIEPFMGKFPEDKPFVNDGGSYGSQANPRAAFAAMITRLDDSIGALYAQLEQLGIADNTLVIFSSDNGAHQEGGADPGFFNSTGVYRGVKRALHEGGIRVPMLATYPGVIPAGVESGETVAFWDVMPTLAEFIGAEIPESVSVDGLSFLETLKGGQMPVKHDYFYWEFHEQGGRQAVLKGEWKLIKQQAKDPGKTFYQLYNLSDDPSEQDNIIDDYPEIAQELKELIQNTRSDNKYWNI